ncbi:MAG: uracil-DNA glycosylase [Thermodesulfovibrionales bacterium]
MSAGCGGAGDPAADLQSVVDFLRALGFDRLPLDVPIPDRTTPARQVREALLRQLREEIGDCRRCKLSAHRTHIVFGDGNPEARIMFIGEAPGREEDIQALPFVGDAGRLLTRLIERMGFQRSDVYIGNIIKCRPPMNRDPEEDEVAACRGFIERQISIISPEAIIALGRIAVQTLRSDPKIRITSARGHFFDFHGVPVMPTFHPAYLLRNPKDKILTWSDAQKVLKRLGIPTA